jgi:hypothetical protein
MPHLSIRRPLLKLNAKLVKAFASLVDVVHSESDVPKPTPRFGVAVGVPLKIGVGLGTVVVRQLEDTWSERSIGGFED